MIAMLALVATIGAAQSDQNNAATAIAKRPSVDIKLKSFVFPLHELLDVLVSYHHHWDI